jgi:hypothetical protein
MVGMDKIFSSDIAKNINTHFFWTIQTLQQYYVNTFSFHNEIDFTFLQISLFYFIHLKLLVTLNFVKFFSFKI